MTPRAPARARLPLLRFRPGGVGLGGATRGAVSSVRDAWGCNPFGVGGGDQFSGRLAEVRNEFSRCRPLEDSPSGLWRQLGKLVGCKPSGVRIPHSPPNGYDPLHGGHIHLTVEIGGFGEEVWLGQTDGVPHCAHEKGSETLCLLFNYLAILCSGTQ